MFNQSGEVILAALLGAAVLCFMFGCAHYRSSVSAPKIHHETNGLPAFEDADGTWLTTDEAARELRAGNTVFQAREVELVCNERTGQCRIKPIKF